MIINIAARVLPLAQVSFFFFFFQENQVWGVVKQANVIELIDGSETQPRLPAAPAALACAELLVSGFNSLNQHIALSSLIHQCNAMRQQRERVLSKHRIYYQEKYIKGISLFVTEHH